ncbi:MAG: UDP-N-acetylglucosamine 2-epimerase (non-hydrolyzing) [Candidatus Nitrosopolaris wilkensis]|nr:MAG: UDP-N-acetylglucosamine 2-epimerase (non-hydrolyzing) [Candidatus Nitrosopolaris wilkensis]
MNIVNFVGTRPEIIKIQPVMKDLEKRGHELNFVHTGQHYDFNMSDIFIHDLELTKPKYFLNAKSQSQGVQTARIIARSERILTIEKPDLVIVTGDTNSALGAAIASSKLGIKVAHVEAGCRSFDKSMAEEINRTLISHVADVHFAPTYNCKKNLLREGISSSQIFLTGHPLVDLIHHVSNRITKSSLDGLLDSGQKHYVLVTLHRRENVTDKVRITDILTALDRLSQKIPVIFPCHPHTKRQITKFAINKYLKNLKVIEPVGYLQSLSLIKYARFVMTDSGGIQQEAALLCTPCITLRGVTEWIETVNAGVNFLAGSKLRRIISTVHHLERDYHDIKPRLKLARNLFGESGASRRITHVIENIFL